MHAAIAIEEIALFLEERLADLRPDDKNGEEREIAVYRYFFPEPASAQMTANADETRPEDYKGIMPAVVVSPLTYEDKALEDQSSLISVSLLVGAFSTDPMNVEGARAVVNILERIRREILTYRLVGEAFEIVEPLTWQMYDDEKRPLWFGEMISQWRILNPFRIDAEDWKGDFIVPQKESEK